MNFNKLLENIARDVLETHSWCNPDWLSVAKRHGVTFVGCGRDRAVYLLPNGEVGKFSRCSDSFQQLHEIGFYLTMKDRMHADPKKFEGWALPEMRLVRTPAGLVVLAQYIDGVPCGGWDNPWNADDMHMDNCRRVDDVIYLIDLGLAS